MQPDFMKRAQLRTKGNQYEDFTVGQELVHHWGRTINASDNSLFSTLTLHFNPLYFNLEYAKAHGHPDIVVNPLLVFNTIIGLSVQDLSEMGGPFLGIDNMTFHKPVYPNDTLTAVSTVVDKRLSSSRPKTGIVTWHTKGFNQRDELVIDLHRTNLSLMRGGSI